MTIMRVRMRRMSSRFGGWLSVFLVRAVGSLSGCENTWWLICAVVWL